MKKLIAVVLCLALLTALTGCTAGKDNASELEALRQQMQQMQEMLNQQEQPAEDAVAADRLYAFNALVDGKDVVEFVGQQTFTAQAVVPEYMAVDCWSVNGMEMAGDEDDTLTFNANGTTFVEARLRPEKTVTTFNAQMKFLNEKDEPKGEAFEQFVFEEEYLNPVTNEWHEGGTITVYVEAVVPKGYVIDYWKINEIPYYYNRTVSNFIVVELDESTVYEVVLRESHATPTPKPTAKPTATPAATPTPAQDEEDWKETATPEPTPEPVMYEVTCQNCKFDGKRSGLVPAGTVIMVNADSGTGDFEVNDSTYVRDASAISVTINSDTFIKYIEEIN